MNNFVIKDINRSNNQNENDIQGDEKINPIKQARLNFFSHLGIFKNNYPVYKIGKKNYRSDHSPVVIYCKIYNLKRDRGSGSSTTHY